MVLSMVLVRLEGRCGAVGSVTDS